MSNTTNRWIADHFFSREENWRNRTNLSEIQELYHGIAQRFASLQKSTKTLSLEVGGIAIRPVTRAAAMTGGGLYRVKDYRIVMLLPVKAVHCPGLSKTGRPYRLHLTQLDPVMTSNGVPAFCPPYHSAEVDFGRRPCKASPIFPMDDEHLCVFDPGSIGGLIEEHLQGCNASIRRLTTPISGKLELMRSHLWVDICVMRWKNARRVPVVLYRFPAADFEQVVRPDENGRRVVERFVRQGETVAVLCHKCLYGRAALTNDGFNVLRKTRDGLQVTANGKSWQDYLTVIGCYLVHDMLEVAEDSGVGTMKPLSLAFPRILGYVPVMPLAIAANRATSATPPSLVEFVTSSGDTIVAESLPRIEASSAGSPQQNGGYLVDLNSMPGEIVPMVQEWYFDLRGNASQYIDSATGAAVLPMFPREDDRQFRFCVHGLELDATPLRRNVRMDDDGNATELRQEDVLLPLTESELATSA
jgi:hypothetical protein